jgi:hypothetical protein
MGETYWYPATSHQPPAVCCWLGGWGTYPFNIYCSLLGLLSWLLTNYSVRDRLQTDTIIATGAGTRYRSAPITNHQT